MNEELHRDLGAYILGALDGDDREAFEDHLGACERCRAELIEFAPVPGLLARIDHSEFESGASVDSAAVVAGAHEHVAGLERSRRRWQLSATALATAALVLSIALVLSGGDSAPPIDQGDPIELVLASSDPVDGRIAVLERGWGARVEIDLLGLPIGQGYEIWAVGADETWELAASFNPTTEGTCRVVGATSLHPGDIARIVITTTDRQRELVWAWDE